MFQRSLRIGAIVALLYCGNVVAADTTEAPRAVSSSAVPAPVGPYSQAIFANGTLYASGQIALDPATGRMVGSDIRVQTKQILANLSAVLAAEGMTLADAVQVQVFLADIGDYAAMNEAYVAAFKPPYPARWVVQAGRLPRDARIEIGLVAVKH